MGIHLLTHTLAKRSSQAKEPAYTQGGKGNDESETSAEILLGWSGEHDCLSNESMHDITPHEKFYGQK